MLKRYRFWLWTAAGAQILTAVVHSLSFLSKPDLQDETARQLFDLMTTYRRNLGAGFQPTTMDLFQALSSTFAFMYLLGGVITVFLLRKNLGPEILKGYAAISVLIFGACFGVMASLTFLPPIILTALVLLLLIVSYLIIPRNLPRSPAAE